MKYKTFKSTLVLVTAALLISGSAFAQHERGGKDDRLQHRGPHDAESRVAHMTHQLDLSDEQSAQLLLVMQEADVEREALHQQIIEQMEPELCGLQLSTEADIRNILTEDQLASMQEMKQERERRRDGRSGRGMGNLDCSAYE